ncbi:MAG: hypothetical protein MUC31_09315, partial [Bacteroidales bacterium]|nr:hypothetical protein [Bacteroidales bacterium]
MKRFSQLTIAALLGAILSVAIYKLLDNNDSEKSIQMTSAETAPVQLASQTYSYSPQVLPDFTQAAGKTVNAVVHVMTEYKSRSDMYDYFFDLRDFFGEPVQPDDGPSYVG